MVSGDHGEVDGDAAESGDGHAAEIWIVHLDIHRPQKTLFRFHIFI